MIKKNMALKATLIFLMISMASMAVAWELTARSEESQQKKTTIYPDRGGLLLKGSLICKPIKSEINNEINKLENNNKSEINDWSDCKQITVNSVLMPEIMFNNAIDDLRYYEKQAARKWYEKEEVWTPIASALAVLITVIVFEIK